LILQVSSLAAISKTRFWQKMQMSTAWNNPSFALHRRRGTIMSVSNAAALVTVVDWSGGINLHGRTFIQ
jgi:hypothetical protein